MASAVSAVGTEPQRAQVTTPVGNGTLDYNAFLKLLLAQMQNQDPLNPMDNAQVTSQMAQIQTVSGIEIFARQSMTGLNLARGYQINTEWKFDSFWTVFAELHY